MRYTEDDENDGHHSEWHHQNEISTVESPKPRTAEQWPIFVRDFNKSPTSNTELISTHEPEQARDDGEIDAWMERSATIVPKDADHPHLTRTRSHIAALTEAIVESDRDKTTLRQCKERKYRQRQLVVTQIERQLRRLLQMAPIPSRYRIKPL